MELSRRDFLKVSGAGMGGVALLGAMNSKSGASPKAIPLKKQPLGETYTICCYCAVGCGALATADAGKVINIEGNPDHPINEGTLCSKGQALAQFRTVDGEDNPNRLTRPLYRRPGGTQWEEISWETAIDGIARNIKKTRDETWVESVNVGGNNYVVNRTDGIAEFGGGELDNEECYLLVKMCRALGMVYVEHCARI
jgi:formate dehydrogenase major subunit